MKTTVEYFDDDYRIKTTCFKYKNFDIKIVTHEHDDYTTEINIEGDCERGNELIKFLNKSEYCYFNLDLWKKHGHKSGDGYHFNHVNFLEYFKNILKEFK